MKIYENKIFLSIIILIFISSISFSKFFTDFSQPWNEAWNSEIHMIDESQIYGINQENDTLYVHIQKPNKNSNYIKFYSNYIIKGENYSIKFSFKKKGYGRTAQGIYFNDSNYFVVGLDTNDANYFYIHKYVNKHLSSFNPLSSDPYKNRVVNITIVRKSNESSGLFYVYADGNLVGNYSYPLIENVTKPRIILWHEVMAWKTGDAQDERYFVQVNDSELNEAHYTGRILNVKSDDNGKVFNATLELLKDGNVLPHGFDPYYMHIYLEGVECPVLWYYDNTNGTYNLIFSNPHVKVLGHLNLTFMIRTYDNTTVIVSDSNKIVQKTKKKTHLLFITGNNFYDTLFVSVLNEPVLVYQKENFSFNGTTKEFDNFEGIADYIRRYDPNEIFYIGLRRDDLEKFQQAFGGYKIKDREFIKENWEPDNYIVIRKGVNENRTRALLAAKIATIFNAQLTQENNLSKLSLPPKNIICTYDCNIENTTILDTEKKLINFIKTHYLGVISSIAILNANDNLSSIGAQLFRYRNSFPIIIDVNPTYNDVNSNYYNGIWSTQFKIRNAYNWIKDSGKLDPYYNAQNEFFIYLIGAPYGIYKDPGNEIFNNYDGDYLFTDLPYIDVNNDGKEDFSVGRITDSLQIQNPSNFNWRKKKFLIIGEYRHSRYADLVPGGMESSLLLEIATRVMNYNTKRYVEERFQDLSKFQDKHFLDQFLTWYQLQEYFVQRILKMIGIDRYVNWALTFKYTLVELDWWKFINHGTISHLERPTTNAIIHDLKNKNMVFFFGIGNNYSWILPEDKDPKDRNLIFDPYPEESPKIYAHEIINHSSFVYDDHSLGGHPGNLFTRQALSYYGSTGIVHDPSSVINFMGFFQLFGRGSSVGKAAKPFSVSVKTSEDKTILSKIRERNSIVKRNVLLKDYVQRIYYGDPIITLKRNYFLEEPDYKIEYSGGKFKIKIKEKPKVSLKNETFLSNESSENSIINFDDVNGYEFDYNKPIVPVKVYKFEIPKDAVVTNITYEISTHTETNVSIPIVAPDEYYPPEEFNSTYPQDFIQNISFEDLDGSNEIVITVIPVIYSNETGEQNATILDDINISIEYESPIEILDFHAINGIVGSNITFTADVVANGVLNATIIIIKDDGTENDTIQLSKLFDISGEEQIKMKWENATLGNYSAILIITKNGNEARRNTHFYVHQKREFMGKIVKVSGQNKVGYVIITPFEKLSYISSSINSKFQYWSHDFYIGIKKNNSIEEKRFITSFGNLFIIKNSTTILRKLIVPRGYIETITNLGEVQENIHGDVTLKNKLADMISFYNSNITLIRERIEAGEFPIWSR